jgi:hypothetical protein
VHTCPAPFTSSKSSFSKIGVQMMQNGKKESSHSSFLPSIVLHPLIFYLLSLPSHGLFHFDTTKTLLEIKVISIFS